MALKRAKPSGLPQVPFDNERCLGCGGGAVRFTSNDVPELLDYLGGKLSMEQLRNAGGKLSGFGTTRCYFAPLSGVAVCARHEKAKAVAR